MTIPIENYLAEQRRVLSNRGFSSKVSAMDVPLNLYQHWAHAFGYREIESMCIGDLYAEDIGLFAGADKIGCL